MFDAVLWDFGGVFTESPFAAFEAHERRHDLPVGFVRAVNSTDPDTNAWARFERNELTAAEFDRAFADESARLGHRVAGADIIALLVGALRPQMVAALDDVIAAGYRTACLTNNVVGLVDVAGDQHRDGVDPGPGAADVAAVMARFELIVESSKLGVRKPEPAFYAFACAELGVEPSACVFLDDLGVNLKPARELGMTTIKVGDPDVAIAELRRLLDL